VLDCEINNVLNYKWICTGYQLCSITYKCYVISLTPKLSIQVAGINVKEIVFVFQQQIAINWLPRDWLFRIGERVITDTLLGMVMGLPQS